MIKDLFHSPPIYKAVITLSFKVTLLSSVLPLPAPGPTFSFLLLAHLLLLPALGPTSSFSRRGPLPQVPANPDPARRGSRSLSTRSLEPGARWRRLRLVGGDCGSLCLLYLWCVICICRYSNWKVRRLENGQRGGQGRSS